MSKKKNFVVRNLKPSLPLKTMKMKMKMKIKFVYRHNFAELAKMSAKKGGFVE
jgi:hypothetical protein